MWPIILGIFAKGNGAKIGGAAIGGTGIITLILSLHGNISEKIENSQKDQQAYMREYVDLTVRPITSELKHQNGDIKETKALVRDIHSYLLKRK
jgi:hypothetical protein